MINSYAVGFFKNSLKIPDLSLPPCIFKQFSSHDQVQMAEWIIIYSSIHVQGCYSETGFHIGMDLNFDCLWHRHNCNLSLPFCADLLIYEINYWVLNNSNFHAIISTLLKVLSSEMDQAESRLIR